MRETRVGEGGRRSCGKPVVTLSFKLGRGGGVGIELEDVALAFQLPLHLRLTSLEGFGFVPLEVKESALFLLKLL